MEDRRLLTNGSLDFVALQFDTELTSLNLSGGPFQMPLASDPGNALGDSINGYGLVNSAVSVTLASQRPVNPGAPSTGAACAMLNNYPAAASAAAPAAGGRYTECDYFPAAPVDPEALDGQEFYVQSFFDVFFDITVTDVDSRPGRDFAGQPDGASIVLADNGPAGLDSYYHAVFDKNVPNFGLIPPPEVSPYMGHFNIEIPLGGDINGNGEDDKIKFTLATHSVGDENRTFIQLPDGTVVDSFDSGGYLEGAVVDVSTDPPFTIGALDPDSGLPDPAVFGGPTTASSMLQNEVIERDLFEHSLAEVVLQWPDGTTESVTLAGPTLMHVTFDGAMNGSAVDDDGDGLDDLRAEMVAMELSGTSSAGPIIVRLDPTHRSMGELEERTNLTPGTLDVAPFTASGEVASFFDVFIEVRLPDGSVLHGDQPARMQAKIQHKPPAPGETYQYAFAYVNPIHLLDANNNPTGISLLDERHTAQPEIEVDYFPYSLGKLTLRDGQGNTETVVLAGPSTVHVTIPADGTAADTDGDGRDQVPTQLVQLELRGTSSMFGPILVTLDPNRPSRGVIQEQVNSTPGILDLDPFGAGGAADSFFDVFPLILAGTQPLYTATPLHIETVITHKPPAPGETYASRVAEGPPVDVLMSAADAGAATALPPACTVPDNGTGTIFLPPAGCEYLSPDEVHMILDGLPPGSSIELAPIHKDFICRDASGGGSCVADDGDPTNGETEVFESTLEFEMRGTGVLAGFQRTITIPNVTAQVQSGPRQPGNVVQGFDTEMMLLQGQVTGDPDFDLLRVTAGTDFGLPSPGHTTLTSLPGGNWAVDSFFDITYRIDFVGAPGGPFAGRSGSTTGTIRMQAASPVQPAEGVELIDEYGSPIGVFVTQEAHTPNPEIEIDVFPNSLAQIVLQTPNGPETVTLAGPTTVEVVIPPDGMAADTDGDGRDQVPTTMTLLDLRGSSSLGPVHVRLDPNRATLGQIEEQQNNTPGTLDVAPFTTTGLADSFFDVFFEIEVGGQVLRTAGSVRMQSVISHKPPAPGEDYVNAFTQPVPLLDANGNVTGLYLLQEIHTPNPENKVEIDYYEETTALVQLAGGPLGPDPKNFILTGPAEIHVLFDGPNEGDAIDSDGDGLEDVATQLVGMNLTDGNVTLRVRDAAQSPYQVTRGEIEERQNNTPHVLDVSPFTPTGSAVSFFDVFFELDVAGVGVLHNEQGLRIRSTIYEKPPYRRYIHVIPPDGPIELYDENNQPTGVRLLQAEHDTGKVEIDVFPETVGQIQIEVPNSPGVVTPNAALPPLEGVYLTAADVHAIFHGPDLEVVLQDVRHRPFAIQPVQIAIVGNDEVERFQSSLQATVTVNSAASNLDLGPIPVEFLGPVVTRVSGKAGQTTGTFDTEMLSMSLSGQIQTPAGSLEVKLRESPTLPSKGRTSISRLPGGNFQIDSFFDVFTELSVDGGRTWIPTDAPVHVQAQNSGIQTPNPDLPPNDGIYRTPGQVHAEYQGADLQIVLQDVRHSAFRDVTRQVVGSDEVEQFQSTVVGIATISGQGLDEYMTEVILNGRVTTVVGGKAGRTSGFFDTEMLQLDLSGQIHLPGNRETLIVMLRESPTQASTGRTSIRVMGNGTYHIDSFFDVFTELTVDGGQTWTPSTTSAAVELTSPPRVETVDVVGPATVAVFFEGPNEGDATDEVYDGFGRDEVQTGILELDMRGSSALGPVVVTQRPGYRSPGQIEEFQQIVPGRLDVPPFGPAGSQAYSWFYVWPQIEIGGRTLVTSQALLIDTFLKHKPPRNGERYESPQPVRVPLLDANGNLTGAYVVREIHQPDPTTEVDQLAEMTALVQLVGGPIGPQPTPFLLRGPAEVHVYFDGPDEGDAVDDDGDGLDEVVTQLVSMNLTDGNVTMRVRDIRESPTLPSLGRIEEQTNNMPGTLDVAPFTATGLADSFFDVFFEIEVGDQVLHNEQPLHVAAVIDHKPPIARYIHFLPPSGPIELIGEDGVGTGVFLVNAEQYTGHLEVDHFEATAASVELIDPRGNSTLLRLRGPSTAHVFFEGTEGQADDDDANGREEVRTELVQLDLHGDSPLGPVAVRLDSRNPSAGAIEETANATPGTLDVPPFTAAGTADSFFDVFFEIEVAGRLMYPATPKRMSSVIDHKPPGEGTVYENPEIIPLVDAAGNLTGYSIGRTRHIPVPKDFIEVDVMPDTTALVQLVGGPLGNLPVPLILHGSSEAHVFFEGPLEGDAEDDDGDGRDDVATQLTSLNLTNGAVTLRLNSAQATLGQIEELVNNHAGLLDLDPFAPGNADSFFDVFFEIELPDQTVVHNGAPLRIQAVISEKPPLARYIHLIPPAGPIELLNANNQKTGVFLVQAEHYTGHIERDVMEQTTALLQLRGIPGGTAVTSFVLNGPSVADVYFEAAEGQARDDDGDGRDEVYTELVGMNLTDGNITLRLHPAQVSSGQIEEQANATPGTLDVAPFTAAGLADSFFDVFFEIELPDGSAVHNQRPVRVQAVIDHKPPIARYIHIIPDNGPIELLDEKNEPTGVYLVRAEHYTGKIEVDYFENSLALIDLIDPQGNSQTVHLSGPSTAHVYFEGSEGQADDDSGNGREEVATEMVQLNLQGSSSFGPVSVRLNPRLPSPGQIEETANATPGTLDVPPFTAAGTADSFFDIFFEIQVGNRLLYPAKAKRMSSVIDHKPPGPGTVYENPETIPLLDVWGRPTGFAIGATRHIPVGLDFGDAPASQTGLSYPTLLSQDGARHTASSAIYLGRTVDAELDGQPNADATGDDVAGGLNDEDGVQFLTRIVPKSTARLEVTASAPGYLNAWMDWNVDHYWGGVGERIFADVWLTAGANVLAFEVPENAELTSSTFARFRFSTQAGLDYRGWAADGEVEDYEIAIDVAVMADVAGRAEGDWTVGVSTGSQFASSPWGSWPTVVDWQDVLAGDFDGDGRDDVAGRDDGVWWVSRSTDSGVVNELWTEWSNAVTWHDVQVGDFNRDGLDDLAGRASNGAWWVAKSTGNGFVNESWGGWAPTIAWQDVQVGDINGDGLDDIVGRADGVWWMAQSNRSRFINQRLGTWSNTSVWKDVQVGDFNGDGLDDVAGRADGRWYVAKSTGTQFVTAHWGTWSATADWRDVSVGDFNNDGRDDIAGRASGAWWVANSNGTAFVTQHWGTWSNTATWEDVHVGDFNNDAMDDIAGRSNGIWTVARSDGTKFVSSPWGTWTSNAVWEDVQVGDFDGDGRDDVLGREEGNWQLGKSSGTSFVNEPWTVWHQARTWHDVQAADVNGDGLDDIVGRTARTWWVARSTGSGFVNEAWTVWSAAVSWEDVRVGDFNGDGLDDIAGRANGAWWVANSTGSGFVNQPWGGWAATIDWQDVLVADINGDGLDDIVGRANGVWWMAQSTGTRFLNQRLGTWSTTSTWKDVQAGDFNGDGLDDVAGRADGRWYVARSTGTQFVTEHWTTWSAGADWRDVSVGDFNWDGRDDIAGRASGAWWVAKSDGTRFVTEHWATWSSTTAWLDVQVGDVNGDGLDDLLGRGNGLWQVAKSTGTNFVNEPWGTWSTAVTWDDVLVGNFSNSLPAALHAAQIPKGGAAALPGLSEDTLQSLAEDVINRLMETEGLEDGSLSLPPVTIQASDLPGSLLAQAVGNLILIDRDAAGFGWFVDATPWEDDEFSAVFRGDGLAARAAGQAEDRMDLLTVLRHELGHVRGYDHSAAGVMRESLLPGMRFECEDWETHVDEDVLDQLANAVSPGSPLDAAFALMA